GLDRSRYRPMIGLLKDGWLAAQLRQRGLETITIPQGRGQDPGWIGRCVRLMRQRKVDVLHTHEFTMNTYGALASVLSRVPMVATVHGKNYYADKWRRRALYRFVARRAVRMVAVAEDVRRYLIERVGVSPRRLCTIYNGVDTDARGAEGEGKRVRHEL